MKKQTIVIYYLFNFIHCGYYEVENQALIIQAKDVRPDASISFLVYKNTVIKIKANDSIDIIKINFLNFILHLLDFVDSAFIFIYGLLSSSKDRAGEKSCISLDLAPRVIDLLCMLIFYENKQANIQYQSIQISQKTKKLNDLADKINLVIQVNNIESEITTFLQELISAKSNSKQSDIVCNKHSKNAQQLTQYMAALPTQLQRLVEEYTIELKAIVSIVASTPCYIYSDHKIDDRDLNSLVNLLETKERILSETLNSSLEYTIAHIAPDIYGYIKAKVLSIFGRCHDNPSQNQNLQNIGQEFATNCTAKISSIGMRAAITFFKKRTKQIAQTLSNGNSKLSTLIEATLRQLLEQDPECLLSMIHILGEQSIIEKIIGIESVHDYREVVKPLLSSIGNIDYISIAELKQYCEILKYSQKENVRECKIDLINAISKLLESKNKNLSAFITDKSILSGQSLLSGQELEAILRKEHSLNFALVDLISLPSMLKAIKMEINALDIINLLKKYSKDNPNKQEIIDKLITEEYSDKIFGPDWMRYASCYIKIKETNSITSGNILRIMQYTYLIQSLDIKIADNYNLRKLILSSLQCFAVLIVDTEAVTASIKHAEYYAALYTSLILQSIIRAIERDQHYNNVIDDAIKDAIATDEAFKRDLAKINPDESKELYFLIKLSKYWSILYNQSIIEIDEVSKKNLVQIKDSSVGPDTLLRIYVASNQAAFPLYQRNQNNISVPVYQEMEVSLGKETRYLLWQKGPSFPKQLGYIRSLIPIKLQILLITELICWFAKTILYQDGDEALRYVALDTSYRYLAFSYNESRKSIIAINNLKIFIGWMLIAHKAYKKPKDYKTYLSYMLLVYNEWYIKPWMIDSVYVVTSYCIQPCTRAWELKLYCNEIMINCISMTLKVKIPWTYMPTMSSDDILLALLTGISFIAYCLFRDDDAKIFITNDNPLIFRTLYALTALWIVINSQKESIKSTALAIYDKIPDIKPSLCVFNKKYINIKFICVLMLVIMLAFTNVTGSTVDPDSYFIMNESDLLKRYNELEIQRATNEVAIQQLGDELDMFTAKAEEARHTVKNELAHWEGWKLDPYLQGRLDFHLQRNKN